jgi:predicted transcriptional regulator
MTLTLEIPEDLAPRLAAMPEKDRQSFALAAMRLVGARVPTLASEPALTQEQLDSIGRGLAQLDAGEGIDGDVFMAELFESVGLPAPEPFNKKAA